MSTTESRNIFWKRQVKDLLIIFMVSIPAAYLSCSSCFEDLEKLKILIPVNFIIWLMLWKGNEFTVDLMNRLYSWIDAPVKRLVGGIIAHTAYTSFAVFCVFYFFDFFLDISLGRIETTLTFSIIATFLITLVLHSISFLSNWRKSAIESERMKKEMISAKYESLKNQVNPHFLFNSLNALSNLVYEDQAQADKFIRKLSEVYRYVLESREKDFVTLQTELNFVRSYLFLQKIRFGEGLKVTIKVDDYLQTKLPPMSLQMLIENAIKHNVVSADQPLYIDLYIENDYLMVVNNLDKKKVLKENSSEMGLSNIKARYSFLTDQPVNIYDDNGKFTVELPLLK